MLNFFTVVVAALIGSLLAPVFKNLVYSRQKVRERRQSDLMKAYHLASKLEEFVAHSANNLVFIIAALQGKLTFEQVPSLKENMPFSELYFLLDYHLAADECLLSELASFKNEFLIPYERCIRSLKGSNSAASLHYDAIDISLNNVSKARGLSKKLICWVKEEKAELESVPTIFNWKFWKGLLHRK